MAERIAFTYQKIVVSEDAREAFFNLTQALNRVYGNFLGDERSFLIKEEDLKTIIEALK